MAESCEIEEDVIIEDEDEDDNLKTPKKKLVKSKKRRISQGDYIPSNENLEVWQNTSKWTDHQTKILKLTLDGKIKNIDEFFGRHFALLKEFKVEQPDIANSAITKKFLKDKKFDSLPIISRIFAAKLAQLEDCIGREVSNPEDYVDGVVSYILDVLGFSFGNLSAEIRPKRSIEYDHWKITSETDFAVRRTDFTSKFSYFFIEESKKLFAPASVGKYQIAGELVVYAVNLYNAGLKNVQLYAWKMRGFTATVIRADFPDQYLDELANQTSPTSPVDILTFDAAFDIRIPEERSQFFEILLKIKHIISQLEVSD